MKKENEHRKSKLLRFNLNYQKHLDAWEAVKLAQDSPKFRSANEYILDAIIAYKPILQDNNNKSAPSPAIIEKIIIEEPPLM